MPDVEVVYKKAIIYKTATENSSVEMFCFAGYRKAASITWHVNERPPDESITIETAYTKRDHLNIVVSRLRVSRLDVLPSRTGKYTFQCVVNVDDSDAQSRIEVKTGFNNSCIDNTDCDARNALCTFGKCECKDFLPVPLRSKHTTCRSFGYIGWPCNYDEQCSYAVQNSLCDSRRKCGCQQYYRPSSDNQSCLAKNGLGSACSSQRDCDVFRAKCRGGHCRCPEGTTSGARMCKCLVALILFSNAEARGQGIMSSRGARSTAYPSRVPTGISEYLTPQDYRVILPTLPTGRYSFNSVFLHGDPSARPYRIDDFRDVLKDVVDMNDVAGFGAFQFNHVWMITLHNAAAKEKLLHAAVLNVKGKTCLVIDSNVSEKSFKVHWVPVCVPDEAEQKTFMSHGKVKSIVREKWRQPGFENVETKTQTVAIPHQINILGMPALVSIPGHPPQCLWCKKVGHMRKQCRTPWCRTCRTYGDEEDNSIQTYAAKTRPPTELQDVNNLMDQDEMEETIAATLAGKASELSTDVVGASDSAPPASNDAEVKMTDTPSPKTGENSQAGQVTPESVEIKDEENRKASGADGNPDQEVTGVEAPIKRKGERSTEKTAARATAADQRFTLVTRKRWKKGTEPQGQPWLTERGASALEETAFED
ncbi:hypothetical protein HPB47_006563 [Ixodes persulcatus]|uniref:Uncharacterized protein n=1 Tax=Ixodes persulcatus TaxID=34615 RepID=A0AC60PA08_IXOPE|nr:hypothetical protein HPB47_006563 [Ixodes persulcatus]